MQRNGVGGGKKKTAQNILMAARAGGQAGVPSESVRRKDNQMERNGKGEEKEERGKGCTEAENGHVPAVKIICHIVRELISSVSHTSRRERESLC